MLVETKLRAIPVDWKSANVVPILKKGSKSDKNNYRPVSLTSMVGKLLESVIRDQMQKLLDENKLIYSCQHVLLRVSHVLQIWLSFLIWFLNGMIKGLAWYYIYLNFRKTFDKFHIKGL